MDGRQLVNELKTIAEVIILLAILGGFSFLMGARCEDNAGVNHCEERADG